MGCKVPCLSAADHREPRVEWVLVNSSRCPPCPESHGPESCTLELASQTSRGILLQASRADLKHPLAGDSMILDLNATQSSFRAHVSDAWAPAGRVAESALQGSVGSGHRFTPILSLAPANAPEHRAPQLSGSLMDRLQDWSPTPAAIFPTADPLLADSLRQL